MDQNKISKMAEGGRLLGQIRDQLMTEIKPGVTGLEIERRACELMKQVGGEPAFKKVPGYHYATCISINEGIVHGIPTNRQFKTGDLVGLDLGLYFKGYYTDTADSKVIGPASKVQQKLLDTARAALKAGINASRVGNRVSDISKAIQKVIESNGFVVIRDLTGHGVGKKVHEDPYIPNYYDPNHSDPVLIANQTIALEPMMSVSSPHIKIDADGWTIVTADKSLSIQVEHTLAVLPSGPQVLT